jgi:hypothetical protein
MTPIDHDALDLLTTRESEVLQLPLEEKAAKDIAVL